VSDVYRDPETTPQEKELEKRSLDAADWGGTRMNPVGPAGRTTNVNGNEKGILEQGLFDAMAMHQTSELGSNHDAFAVGIYASTDSKFSD